MSSVSKSKKGKKKKVVSKNNKKKHDGGYTLIELLATITVLSLVSVIVIYTAVNVVDTAYDKSYQVTINNVQNEASSYVLENQDIIPWFSTDPSDTAEYQCVTVQDLIDTGYFKSDILDSKISSGNNVMPDTSIYLERNADNKAITKSILLTEEVEDAGFGSLCDSISQDADITFKVVPTDWSKEKDITINYRLLNIENNVSNYSYNYNYANGYKTKSNTTFNRSTAKETFNVSQNGTLIAEIPEMSLQKSLVISKIDNIKPVILEGYDGRNTFLDETNKSVVMNKVIIPLKISDEMPGSGVDGNSFKVNDIEVTIGGVTIDSKNISLKKISNESDNSEYNYELTIKDNYNRGSLIIVIDNNKVFDKAENGNEKAEFSTYDPYVDPDDEDPDGTVPEDEIIFDNDYFINYHANTGTGSMSGDYCTFGENCSIKNNTFTKTGYTFIGWTTKSDGSDDGYGWTGWSGKWEFENGMKGVKEGQLHLYARWRANTYTISYDMNDGTKGSNAPTNATYDRAFNVSLPSKTITITGDANGTGATVGNPTSKTISFAGWTSSAAAGLDKNTAKYGASNDPATSWDGSILGRNETSIYLKNLTPIDNATVTITANWTDTSINLPTLSKLGYTCKWYLNKNGTGTSYNSGASYTPDANGNKSITVYAKCTANTYTISYTMNGGTLGSSAPTNGTYDQAFQVTKPTKTVTVTGNANGINGLTIASDTSKAQTFAGWSSSTSDGLNTDTAKHGTSSSPSTSWNGSKVSSTYFMNLTPTNNGSVTMTANWTPVSFNLPTITKTGYTCGWNSSSSGTTIQYASGASYTPTANSDARVTMYAVCIAHTYTISYDMKNGTKGSSTPTSATYDVELTISNPTKKITITGDANGTNATIGNATSNDIPFEGWTFDGDTNTAMHGSSSANTKWSNRSTKVKNTKFKNLTPTDNATVTMTANWTDTSINLPTLEKTGYTCKWYLNAGSTGTAYESGASYTPDANGSENITVYAKCTANTYNISYEMNNGTLGSSAPTSATYDKSFGVTKPTKTITIIGDANGTGASVGENRSNSQTFAGWTSNASAGLNTSTAKYGASSDASSSWSGSKIGGNNSTTYFKNLTPTNNGSVTITANWTSIDITLPSLTKVGYTCNWYLNKDGTGTAYKASTNYTPDANGPTTITVYAKCTPISYTIEYKLNNGTLGSNAPTSAKYDEVLTIDNPSKTVTIVGNVNGTGATIKNNNPSKAQTFAGWTFSGGDLSTAKYGTSASSVTTDWKLGNTKTTAKYFKNLASIDGSKVTMTANWTGKPITLPTVTKTGYTCKWNSKSDGSGTDYNSGGSYTPSATSATSVTLYARCTANEYTVSYNANGGENTPASQTKIHDTNLTLRTSIPTRSGYTFVNWNSKSDGTGKTYEPGAIYKDNANLILYAQWKNNDFPYPRYQTVGTVWAWVVDSPCIKGITGTDDDGDASTCDANSCSTVGFIAGDTDIYYVGQDSKSSGNNIYVDVYVKLSDLQSKGAAVNSPEACDSYVTFDPTYLTYDEEKYVLARIPARCPIENGCGYNQCVTNIPITNHCASCNGVFKPPSMCN